MKFAHQNLRWKKQNPGKGQTAAERAEATESWRRQLVAAGALRRAKSMTRYRRKLEIHLARAGVARVYAYDAAMTPQELAARSAAWEAARDAARRADEAGAQHERRAGERRDGNDGLGGVAADVGMLRAASTQYETDSPVVAGLRVIRPGGLTSVRKCVCCACRPHPDQLATHVVCSARRGRGLICCPLS